MSARIGDPCPKCNGTGSGRGGLTCGWCSGNGDTWADPYSVLTTDGNMLVWTCPDCLALVAEPTEHKQKCSAA